MSVGADAAKPDSYGKFQILRLPDTTQVPGPVADREPVQQRPEGRRTSCARSSRPTPRSPYGNLLTLPVGGGLLYVQPLYTLREGGSGNYPVLRFVLSSFGRDVGIGSTLSAVAGRRARCGRPTTTPTDRRRRPAPDTRTPGRHPGPAGRRRCGCCSRPTSKFAEADTALKAGDLEGYAKAVDEARGAGQAGAHRRSSRSGLDASGRPARRCGRWSTGRGGVPPRPSAAAARGVLVGLALADRGVDQVARARRRHRPSRARRRGACARRCPLTNALPQASTEVVRFSG